MSAPKRNRVFYDTIGRVKQSFNTDDTYKEIIYKQKWTVIINELNHAVLTEIDGLITRSYSYTGAYDKNNNRFVPVSWKIFYELLESDPPGLLYKNRNQTRMEWDDHNKL